MSSLPTPGSLIAGVTAPNTPNPAPPAPVPPVAPAPPPPPAPPYPTDPAHDPEWLALMNSAPPVARKVLEAQGAALSPVALVKALSDIHLLPPTPSQPARPQAPPPPPPPGAQGYGAPAPRARGQEAEQHTPGTDATALALAVDAATRPLEPAFDGAAALRFWSVRLHKTLKGAVRVRKRRMNLAARESATHHRNIDDDEVAFAVLVEDWACPVPAAEMYSSEFEADRPDSIELNMGDFGAIINLLVHGRQICERNSLREVRMKRERELSNHLSPHHARPHDGSPGEVAPPDYQVRPRAKRGRPRRTDPATGRERPPNRVRRTQDDLYAELETRVQDVLRKDQRYFKNGWDWKLNVDYYLIINEVPCETPDQSPDNDIPRFTLTIRCRCSKNINVSIQTHASTINIGGFRRHILQTCRAFQPEIE